MSDPESVAEQTQPSSNGSLEISAFRELMPITKKWAYFDHAAVGPLPQPSADVISQWCTEATNEGDTVWPDWNRSVNETRTTSARLIGADPDEIALVPNTTAGISLVAEGMPWKPGDNIVTLANEFPSNLYPWMHLKERGVETRMVEVENGRVDLDRILNACDDRTRIVSCSWIGFASGFRIDLAKFVDAVHARGALFFLDAIQGVGVFPLNVRDVPIDFLAADGHKWMLGPEGAGIFYVRKQHLDLLRPIGVGWYSVVHCFDFSKIKLDLKPAAARYEGGTMNAVGFMALNRSLKLLEQVGLTSRDSKIATRIIEITDYACERLRTIGADVLNIREPGHQSGIVSFQLQDRDLNAVRKQCLDHGIVLSFRNGCLRISPHAYNNEAEVDQLIECLSAGG